MIETTGLKLVAQTSEGEFLFSDVDGVFYILEKAGQDFYKSLKQINSIKK